MAHDRFISRNPLIHELVARLAPEFDHVPRRVVEIHVRGALADVDSSGCRARRRVAERQARRNLRAATAPPPRHAAPGPSGIGCFLDLAGYLVRRIRNGGPRHRSPYAD